MDISCTLWTMKDILEKIPFDRPAGHAVHLSFSDMEVPYYVKNWFKVSFLYVDDTFPADAACCIVSPKATVTIVIIIKQRYEDALNKLLRGDASELDLCYRRRELYCHEACHLIAIIMAYPSNRSNKVRKDFVDKIRKKFHDSINEDQSEMASGFISREGANDSPSVFDRDHFRYENDNLNYFRLYAELMLPYDTLYSALNRICIAKNPGDSIYISEILEGTLVQADFFGRFPDKKAEIIKILEEGFS